MIEITSGVIYGLFFAFLLIGALLGLRRGLIKATIRIITILVACVAVIFMVTPITEAILTTDISSTGLTIGEIPVTNINDTIIAYVGQLIGVGSLLSASPTLVAFISAVPKIIINFILFIVLFFIVKGILYFVDIFLNKLFIKKDENKPKRRLWGALIGGVQGIICFLFCFIPIAGSMNLINECYDVVNVENSTELQAVSLTTTTNAQNNESVNTKDLTNSAKSTIETYNNIFIIKAFNAIGYEAITNSVFDKLTTINLDSKNSTTLRNESLTLSKIVVNAEKLQNVDIANFTKEDEQIASEIIDDAFNSQLIGGIANEIVSAVADAWAGSNPTEFMGISRPELDTNLLNSFDSLLLNLRTNSINDTKQDLKVIISTLKISAYYDITSCINTGNIDLIVNALGQDNAMEDIISTLSSGKATKQIIPSFVEFGLNYGYTAIGIDGENIEISKTANDVNWEREPEILGNMFEGMSDVYESSKGTGPILNRLDLTSFAKVLESIRDSELLSNNSQEITVNLLSSSMLDGVDCDIFISYVENDTTYSNLNFTQMFSTLKSSTEIANDIKEITGGSSDTTNLNSSSVGTLLEGLTGNNTTKEVIKELASEDNLTQSGVDSATAGAVNTLINSVTEYDTTIEGAVQPPSTDEEKEQATNAVQDLLIASKNAKTNEPNKQIFETQDSMESFVDNMLSSPFIWAVTIDKGVELGFKTDEKTNLSEIEENWLDNILSKKVLDEECTNEQADKIRDMFYPV